MRKLTPSVKLPGYLNQSRAFFVSYSFRQAIVQGHSQQSIFFSIAQCLRQGIPENIRLAGCQLTTGYPEICGHRRPAYQQLGFPDLHGCRWLFTAEH